MNEEAIAEQQRQNIPQPEAFVPTPESPAEPTDGSILSAELDELSMFKIHDYFGEQYSPGNQDSKTRIQFIFDNIAEQIGSRDYLTVMSRVSELESMIGLTHIANRSQRLYQWVGLDRIRRQTEKSMRLIHG